MQRILLFLIGMVWATVSFAQPANDLCDDATVIPAGDLDDGTGNCVPLSSEDNTGATTWEISPGLFYAGSCWGSIETMVFYSFTAQGVSGSVQVSNGPAGENPFVAVLQFNGAACDGTDATELGCSDDGSAIIFDNDLVVGEDYYVVVGFSNSAEGTFDLCVFNPEPAPNDACANAIELTDLDGNCSPNQSNYYPSSENNVPACFGTDNLSVWYYFTAQGVSIADLHIDGNIEDANVAIWDFSGGGSCTMLGGGTILACDTDVDANNPIVLDNDLVIGNDYYIEITFNNDATNEAFQVCLDNPVPAVNDDCIDAIEYPDMELSDESNCLTVISGDAINNDWPSTDIATPACWDAQSSYNVWFYFTAQGPDANIEIDMPGSTEQIALIDFTQSACQLAGATVIGCSNGQDLEINNQLTPGHVYYVMVGFDDNDAGDYCINIFNPIPPDNDTVCAAIPLPTDGSCNAGPPCLNDCYTTEYANPEFNPNQFPVQCQPFVQNTVWFTVELQDPENVGFEINIQEGTGQDFSVIVGQFNDCNGTFFIDQVFCGEDYPIEFGPVEEGEVYYIMVGTAEDDEGTFTICVDEIPPCFDNNWCEDPLGVSSANEITGVVSNGPFVCIEGCNQYADPLAQGTPDACDMGLNPVVWYTLTTDDVATLMNIQVTSDDIQAPSIQLYSGTCDNLNPVPQTSSNLLCVTGSQGEAVANGTTIANNQVYYIAVSGVNTVGGDFEICVNTIEQASACVLDADIEITARSFGGSLEGPFFPGETISVCMNVNQYTPVGNGCQWFQGIIPVFGNGWDPSSFDGNGQPMNATMNGATFPTGGVYNSSTWDWWTDVTYHHDNLYYQVGDFDGNGTLDMCNSLYDPDCLGPGITGGMAPPCWLINPGSLLPPGWFTSGVTGLCGTDGYPGVDWGDGSGCGSTMGPWEFCFDLNVRDAPDCATDDTYSDLTLTFFTFADGEVGSWNGGPSVCALDQPLFLRPPMCCVEVLDVTENLDPICTEGVFSYLIDYNNFPGASEVDFWEWTVDAGNAIVGAEGGSGANGTLIINTLENTGSDVEIVTYNFLGFAGGECPAIILSVNIEVYPELLVEMTPFTVCSTPNNPYTIIPQVSGGHEGNYSYEWHDGSSDSEYEVANPTAGATYTVTVTDDVGCSGTASVVLDVYTTFPVDIDAPVTEQCLSDGDIDLSASAEDGMPAYSFEWTSPTGQNSNGPNVTADENGQWNVVVTDSEGCVGEDSISVEFWESPVVEVFPQDIAVCLGNSNPLQIQAFAQQGRPPYTYLWTTPSNSFTTSFILADEIGNYNVVVTDANGCSAEISFDVDEAPSPTPDIGGVVQVCEEELVSLGYEIDVPFDPSFLLYEWSTGQGGSSSITVYEPGIYTVTVTNDYGCEGSDDIVIDLYPAIETGLPDSISFCSGGFAQLEGDPSYDYDWSTGGSGPLLFVFDEQLVLVTVTDVNGCTAEDEVQVIESDFLQPDIIGDSVICNGVPVDIIANLGFETYEWSTGEDDVTTITVTSGGWYYVTVSDGDGCFGTDSVLVIESAPNAAIVGEPAICDGQSATLDVGSWADIDWSTGESSSMITTDTGGTFMVTVTDQFGCQTTASHQVVESTSPDPQIAGSTSFCTGSSTTLDAGASYASYLWSTSETTQTINVNTTSTIFLTVTNSEGCEGYDTISVTESTALTPSIAGDDVICNSVPVNLDAGAGYASYAWSTTETGQVITVSTGGTYIVTVTDASGCTGTDQIVVNAGDPTPTIAGDEDVCQGGSGTIGVVETFSSYAWSTTETTQSINVNTTGTYVVTVTDQYGCTAEQSFLFTVNNNPVPNIQGSTTYCSGGSTQLSVSTWAGYLWTGGAITQSITVSAPGTYFVTVTDANGCTGVDQVDVIESTELVLNVQDTSICEGESVTLEVGNFATYDWSTTESTPTIVVSSGGTYSVTVSDGQGCTGSASIVVDEYPQPYADVTSEATACNTSVDGSTVDFSSLVTGGDLAGIWTDVDGSGASGTFPILDFDGVPVGQYTFEYTTNSAIAPCEDVTYEVTVTIQDCTCPSPQINTPAPLCADAGMLDLTTLLISGVTQPGGQWSIISDPGGSNPAKINGTTFDASGADPGIYEIQYTLSGLPVGCVDNDVQQLLVNAPADAGAAGQPAQICVGEDTTIVLRDLIVGGDSGGMWVETSVTPSVAGFDDVGGTFNTALEVPGVYTFEYIIAGTAPCPDASTTIEVYIENVPVADAGSDGTLTCDITSIEIGGAGTSQGPEFVYLWTTANGQISGDPTLPEIVVKKQGTYTLAVENTTTGCKSFDDVTIIVDGDIPTEVAIDLKYPICEGDPPSSLVITNVTGGTPPYMYSLNGGTPSSNTSYQDLDPGDYTLAVVDAQGCRIETDFSIPVPGAVDGSIEGDVTISAGEEVVLTYNLTQGTADSTVWFDADGIVLCSQCDTLILTPESNMEVFLTIFDESLCNITLSVNLNVIKTHDVYVPNVFSPNNDGANDLVTVFGPEGTMVTKFEVFSRWGELVYKNNAGFTVNSLSEGWDGTFAGQEMMPGVFVYHALVVYTDGFEETIKGDITLIR